MRDILIAAGKIAALSEPGVLRLPEELVCTLDCAGLTAFPGFIDQHMHFAGAGGEGGYPSRTREMGSKEIFEAGITTAVGLLGADGVSRSLENLYAKAKALEAEGLSTFIYSGSYTMPPVTLTGSLMRDLLLIDKVIGVGELALSDHRSSNPDADILTRIASQAHLGGLLSGKAGIVHLHIGDGKKGLDTLLETLELSDLPAEKFIPTHVNRHAALFEQATDYCRTGGRIDLTAGEKDGIPVPEAIARLRAQDVCLSCVTVSSDAGGSIPAGGVGPARALYDDFAEIIAQSALTAGEAAALFTENVAKGLQLYPQKGTLQAGSDADILITDEVLTIRLLISGGQPVLNRL